MSTINRAAGGVVVIASDKWAAALAVVALVWTCLALIGGTEAAWYRIRGPTTRTGSVVIDGSFHLVTLSDVTFSGSSAVLRINVGDMMAQQGTRPLTIQLCSCTFLNGASMYLYGRTTPTSTAANSGPMNLIILGLTVTNAGIAFYGEMPFNSRISIVRPKYYISGNGGSSFSLLGGSRPNSGLLFKSAAFRSGSFLFYGQPLSLTANTFEGSNGYDVIFESTNYIASGCMFHIYQLSSKNTFPIYGPSASVYVQGTSVFYIEEMEALSCTTCLRIDNIVLQSTSVFLLNRGNFAGSAGLQFSGSADSSQNWFGMMGNTYDVGTAVYGPSGSSSFSGNYMSIYGNYYRSSWSQSASTCYAMCNSLAGNLVSTPASGCAGQSCIPSTLCNWVGAVQCYARLGTRRCASQKPYCDCSSGATTDFCIPFAAPKIPTACISTDSGSVSVSTTLTFYESETRSGYSLRESESPTMTNEESLSESGRSPSLSKTPSDIPSTSFSDSVSISITSTQSKFTESFAASFSVDLSPTRNSLTLSKSPSPDSSLTRSLSLSESDQGSESDSPSLTPTLVVTPSHSESATSTYTETPSKSDTASLTDSWCEWFTLGITPIYPLRRVNGTNDTMEIEYQQFRDDGANYLFDDLGQWWIKNYSWVGDPASNITLFTFDNLTVIIPKITEDDWHATNPIRVGVFLHKFPPDLYYNSELLRYITVGVTFRCAVINKTSYWQVQVNPHHAIVSASASQIAMRSAMLASALMGTPYGSSIAAMALNMQQLMLCQPLTDTDQFDVTGMLIGDDDKANMRGAIIGNVVVVIGQFFLMMCVMPPALHWNKKIGDLTVKEDFFRILRVLQLPTSMHVSVSAVLQLIVAASVSLFRMSDAPADITLGVFGMLVCAAYTLMICYRAVRIYIDRRGFFKFPKSLMLPIRVLPKEEDQFLYGEYDKPWYAGFETFFLLVVGLICGSPTAVPYDCTPQYMALAFISVVSAVIILYYRPMATMAGQVWAVLLRVVTIVMCGCSHVMTRSRENQFQALDGATICLLLITAFAFGRALYDLRRAYRGLPWLIRAIFRLKQPEPDPQPDLLPELTTFPLEPEPILLDDSSSDSDYAPQENLAETEVVGFLGKASEEVEHVDDLLMAFRKKKVRRGGHLNKKDLDLEQILKGNMSGSSSSSSSDDVEEDVRRVVRKAPLPMMMEAPTSRQEDSSGIEDDDPEPPMYDEAMEDSGAEEGGNPLCHIHAPRAMELHSTSDESLQFTNSDERDAYHDVI